MLLDKARFSEAMVSQQLIRSTFRSPGRQLLYGYSQLIDHRVETGLALGDDFDRMAFNDFLLSRGRIPIARMAQAVRESVIPSQAGK